MPIWVVTNGIPNELTSRRNMREVCFRFAAAPTTSNGRRACSSRETAAAIDFASAAGRRTRLALSSGSSTSSRAMSSGSSRCTAPGFSSWATRNASRTREGMFAPLTSCRVYFVSGRIMSTMSTTWNWPCLLDLTGFWPVIINIGMPPSWA